MILSCIAAMSENRVIGADGGLPWKLPRDMAHFRRTTMGHPVIMGRKTWESLPGPLDGRTCVVVTRRPDYAVPPGVRVAGSLPEAVAAVEDAEEAFVIGGGELFDRALPLCDRVYLTVVHARVDGDTFFPAAPAGEWRIVSEHRVPADERNPHDVSFRVYERVEP